MSGTIIDTVGEPWSGKLLFSSDTAEWFYGEHYSDCLIHWDIVHALLGLHVDALAGELELAPPKMPVKAPVFGRLYYGQVEFACEQGGVTVTLTNAAQTLALIRRLSLRLPDRTPAATPQLVEGAADEVEAVESGAVLCGVRIAPDGGRLVARWP